MDNMDLDDLTNDDVYVFLCPPCNVELGAWSGTTGHIAKFYDRKPCAKCGKDNPTVRAYDR